jgi:hypothetical protein
MLTSYFKALVARFKAVRHIVGLVGQCLIAESVVVPGSAPTALLFEECVTADQGLNYVALIPSQLAVTQMFLHSGLKYLYKIIPQPGHYEFRGTCLRYKQRVMLFGSRLPLEVPMLQPIEVPRHHPDPWARSRTASAVAQFSRHVGRLILGKVKIR